MAVFNFPYHKFATERPESGFRVKMGGSYQFSAPPPAPDQRVFKLTFKAMKYFLNSAGQIDRTKEPLINLALLEDFYDTHKLYGVFTYPHPAYGNVSVCFSKPLNIPQGTEGGNGLVENIEIELVEQPGRAASTDLTPIQTAYGVP